MLAFEIRINDAAQKIVAADNHVIADFIYGVGAVNLNSVVIAGFDDAMQMYVNFRGKEPNIEPLLKNRGLK